jgi:HAD superfamily hydrolase (TIGR01484 family)
MNAYIFDVDGVITEPALKKVEQKEILQKIARLLADNNPVALNTGRSLTWINERVIDPLLKYITDKADLENLFPVGEKGGTWLTFDKDGNIQHHKDETISTPSELQNKIKDLIKNNYSESMFYDNTKETMISTEMHDSYSISEYKQLQDKLVKQMNDLLNNMNLSQTLKIDPTTIATDIENKTVGKDFAVKRIIEYINDLGLKIQKFIAFGDSKSDIPMAAKLHEQKIPVELVYVGKNTFAENEYPFPVTFTQEKFDKGTLEYLKQEA